MKMNYKTLIFLIFSTLLFSSCTSMLYTSIDVLRPAKVIFEPNADKLLIINNTIPQPHDYGHKSQLLNEKIKNVSLDADSLPLFCLSVLTEEIINKDFFKQVNLQTKSINNRYDFFKVYPVLNDTINKLCEDNASNVVLSLDKIRVNDNIDEYFLQDENSYYASLVVRLETQWSIHYPNKQKFESITFKDTLFWEAAGIQRTKALLKLPKRWDALVDGALYVGKNSVNKLIPYWDKTDRYFFLTNNKFIKQGMDSVYVKNWEAAIKIWENALNSKNKSTIAKALNNIAIAYEILDDFEKADESITNALETLNSSSVFVEKNYLYIQQYYADLKKRKKEIQLINKQLGEIK